MITALNGYVHMCTIICSQTWVNLYKYIWGGDLWASAAKPDITLTASSTTNGVTEKCEFGKVLIRRPKFDYTG